ncbi:hypothetical protein BDV12DRAFT_179451 [Aspergillus spectabilis]
MDIDKQPVRPHKVFKKRYPVIPSVSSSSEDIVFKRESSEPWDDYGERIRIKPGIYLAFRKRYPHSAVMVHMVESPPSDVNINAVVHRNIVQLYRIYISSKCWSLVYGLTMVSMKDILTFRPCWGQAETAALSRGVLQGLKHLHEILHISHGDLRPETIRIELNGLVKLSHVGESQLRNNQDYSRDLEMLAVVIEQLGSYPKDSLWQNFLDKLKRGEAASSLLKHAVLGRWEGEEQLHHCAVRWLASLTIR